MSDSKRMWLKSAGICGVVGPLVALSSIALAISRSPWFSWTANALSDLGAWEGSATLFNSGLILGGVLLGAFSLGLRDSLRGRALGNAGGLSFLLAAAALCAVGIFPSTAGDIHLYASFAFFLLLPISLWLVGAALLQLREGGLGAPVIISGVVAFGVWTLPWPAVAIPEIISSLSASASSVALGVRLFRRAEPT